MQDETHVGHSIFEVDSFIISCEVPAGNSETGETPAGSSNMKHFSHTEPKMNKHVQIQSAY